jgi:hypothetical protein
MNQVTVGDFARTINSLAAEGKTFPCALIVQGQRYEFNSHWAATDWLKTNGWYEMPKIANYSRDVQWVR